MVAWPGTVPEAVLIRGYSEQVEDNVGRFKPEVGPAKLRRRTSITQTLYQFQVLLTSDEYDDLLDFYRTDLKDGSLEVVRTHPRTGVTDKTFVFTAAPTSSPVSHNRVVASLSMRGID